MPSHKHSSRMLLALGAMALAGLCHAVSPDDVLVESAEMRLTRADYEAALARIPGDLREEFATSSRRVTQLLNNILITKTLAARARSAGLAPEPGMAQDTPADLDRALAAAETHRIEETAGQEFDARRDQLVVTARETWLVSKDQYRRPEAVQLSAILISTEGRGNDAALALARSTRDKLVAWADFATLAREISEDKASAPNGGKLPWASADQMDPTLAKAAFALKVGEVSEPVLVGKSYIIIRLDARRPSSKIPFDEVKDSILAAMRAEYVTNARETQLAAIRNDPALKVDQAAVDALIIKVDPNLYKPPMPAPSAGPASEAK